MNSGIGEGKTRADHPGVANQLYAAYAEGRDLRKLVAIIGEEALSDRDRAFLRFAKHYEEEFIQQGYNENRDIDETLEIAWKLLSILPKSELKRCKAEYIEKYLPETPEEWKFKDESVQQTEIEAAPSQ